jgi:hypothetical protein
MLRPFWCNDSTTTLRTLDDWPFMHGDLSLSPTPMKGRSLKNRARLRNPHQLLLQDLSDSRAADRGEYRQAAGSLSSLPRLQFGQRLAEINISLRPDPCPTYHRRICK